MSTIKRRLVYISLYEFFAIILSALLLHWMSKGGAAASLGLAIIASAAAIIWNLIFNSLFERWEASRNPQGRSIGIRILHAIGFEGGLLLMLIPLVAWWYGVSLWQALLMDVGLLVFFLFYTFCFTWLFDRVFGLPAAAQTHCA